MSSQRLPVFGSILLLVAAAFAAVPPCARVPEPQSAAVSARPQLSEEQIRQFLLTAKVLKSRQTRKGITNPYRLTLSDGALTHDASFQAIDVRKPSMQLAGGRVEINFRDSYHYNIAAFELAKLVGLGDMMPVTVERKWSGNTGSLSWWLDDVMMDEAERLEKKKEPEDAEEWNKQMHRMRVFTELVYDTDRNLTNVLICKGWKLYMIDFSRAFRLYLDLQNEKNLVRCDRQLLGKLRQLDRSQVQLKTKGQLNKMEIDGVMARRDKIVAYFERLIAQSSESAVLY
jgi:hypothetical protein